MPFIATPEQRAIIDAEIASQCVIACAGSGKTTTAVRRLLEIRKKITSKGYVALLSYSKIAVDTFRRDYSTLANGIPRLSSRVHISTVDSFIASQIVLPHAERAMQSSRQPFLVRGHEPFLNGFTIPGGDYPTPIDKLRVSIDPEGGLSYAVGLSAAPKPLAADIAEKAIVKLGKVGAYTYELGRYWALLTLKREPKLLRSLAIRFPHILVDEAQDVGGLHAALLTALHGAGSTISLIGDPNQSIFEFTGADGSYLRNFSDTHGVSISRLTENRRSLESIVKVANAISGTNSKPIREAPARKNGAYVVSYRRDSPSTLVERFSTLAKAADYGSAVVLCRGDNLVKELGGDSDGVGQGATQYFALAAVARERQDDIAVAFEFLLDGILRLLEKPSATLRREVLAGSSIAPAKTLRRALWKFLKKPDAGLPQAGLAAKTIWQPLLKSRVEQLLRAIKDESRLDALPSWKNNLTVAKLDDAPLWSGEFRADGLSRIPIKTVHKTKGESIGAVLYIAKKRDVDSLLNGPITEEGRIGYVAITRAQDLLILGVPDNLPPATLASLKAKGFVALD